MHHSRMNEYPFQFSGGMKQRMMIAMALAGEPELLIADEPTTALDVTIQAQVLDLMRNFQQRDGMAILLITHDLGVAAEMAHRVGIMYAGEIVETAPREEFFRESRASLLTKIACFPAGKRQASAGFAAGGNKRKRAAIIAGICRLPFCGPLRPCVGIMP